MTSRFREEMAARGWRREAVEDAVGATVRTAGRAVFFSGLTVLLGLLGLVLFEFMILRSVGIAGAIVVALSVVGAMTLLPAILAIIGRQHRSPAGAAAWSPGRPQRASGRASRGGSCAARWPCSSRRSLVLLLLGTPFLHVRFNAPDARILPESVPSRQSFDRLTEEFGPGPFAPIVLAIRTPGPATDADNLAALMDYSRRLAADPRIERVDSLVDVDPRLTLEQYALLYGAGGGPPDRFVAEALARDDPRRPDRVHDHDAVRARTTRPAGGSCATCAPTPARSSPPGGMTVLVGGGAADVEDVVTGIGAEFPRSAAVHLRHDLPRAAAPAAVARPAAEGAGDEHAVDRRVVRRARLDLPGRQPVGAVRDAAARVRRDDPAGDPVLRPVRAVDGLRGVPAQPDARELGGDPRQPDRRRPRARAERPDRHLRGADRHRRRRARSRSRTSC